MIHENSKTSYEDHKKSGRRDGLRISVFNVIRDSIEPITDREVMDILGENDPNNVRPEITRLKDDGLVCEGLKTKCKKTGKTVRTVKWTGVAYFARGKKPAAAFPKEFEFTKSWVA